MSEKRCESNGCIEADIYESMAVGSVVRVRSTQTGTVMQAGKDEWVKFIDEVKAGDWDELTNPLRNREEEA